MEFEQGLRLDRGDLNAVAAFLAERGWDVPPEALGQALDRVYDRWPSVRGLILDIDLWERFEDPDAWVWIPRTNGKSRHVLVIDHNKMGHLVAEALRVDPTSAHRHPWPKPPPGT